MLTGIKSFDSLERAAQRCRHNLWRKKNDKNEILTDETYRYIQSHPEIIEIQHYLIDHVFDGVLAGLAVTTSVGTSKVQGSTAGADKALTEFRVPQLKT